MYKFRGSRNYLLCVTWYWYGYRRGRMVKYVWMIEILYAKTDQEGRIKLHCFQGISSSLVCESIYRWQMKIELFMFSATQSKCCIKGHIKWFCPSKVNICLICGKNHETALQTKTDVYFLRVTTCLLLRVYVQLTKEKERLYMSKLYIHSSPKQLQ